MRNNIGLSRGKRVDNEEWIEGYFVKKLDPLLLTEMCFILVQEYDTSCIDGTPTVLKSEMTWYRVHPESVGQYTGLTDKNGKIFEGDIVECITSDCIGYPRTFTITIEDMTDYRNISCLDYSDEIKVIGNVIDNPRIVRR